MTRVLYVVTADLVHREEDGIEPEEGYTAYRSIDRRRTWVFDPDMPIGEIMELVHSGTGVDEVLMNVTITEDEVSAKDAWKERVGGSS